MKVATMALGSWPTRPVSLGPFAHAVERALAAGKPMPFPPRTEPPPAPVPPESKSER